MSRPELYISIDIETDGPAPGLNSMLALGAAAFGLDGSEGLQWYSAITPLPGAVRDPDTMAWWRQKSQRAAWQEVNTDPEEPGRAIASFVEWLENDLRGYRLIAVGWPIAFDFAFVNYYCHKFTGRNPLGFAGLDIRSYANGLANHPQYYSLPEASVWKMAGGEPDSSGLRPHHALDDAIGQGRLFTALRQEALARQEVAGNPYFRLSATDEIRFTTREQTIGELANMESGDLVKILSIYRH
jgi:3'-5' exoribonuclease-like protein